MVKFVKIGRFAIAYDDKKSERQGSREAGTPPTHPPKPENSPSGSGWATFGKVMLVLIGLFVLLIVIAGLSDPAPTSNGAPVDATSIADLVVATPQAACERSDVQELVGKEARRIYLDGQRSQMVALALFGLLDPQDVIAKFENANVSFSGVLGWAAGGTTVSCTGGMRVDFSDANSGQDIIQAPALSWQIVFADGDGDLGGSNFTIDIDPASAFDGVLVNGKSVGDGGEVDDSAAEGAIPSGRTDQEPTRPRGEQENPGVSADHGGSSQR